MAKLELEKSVNKFISDRKDYYEQWLYNEPVMVSRQHNQKLKRLQKILYKIINEFVINFENYEHLILISQKTKQIMETLKNVSYTVGTYRTDFVYDEFKQPKLIEITCRFALNGVFSNAIPNDFSKRYHNKYLKGIKIENDFDRIFDYITELSGDGDIFILKGKDLRNESTIFKNIFIESGKKVIEINYEDIPDNLDKIKEGWIISELTLDEIESLDLNTIHKISQLNITNDFRTALLIHDKQFFSVLGNKSLQNACLSADEINLFKDYYIPTYHIDEHKEYWEDSKGNKDNWILKHRALGKSKSVYAGIVTSQEDWDMLFQRDDMKDFVLQKWVPQIKIKGKILDKNYDDYITGTLLFFNDNYFGLGIFRASSFPITNVVDDRKLSFLVIEDDFELNKKHNFLNYINS